MERMISLRKLREWKGRFSFHLVVNTNEMKLGWVLFSATRRNSIYDLFVELYINLWLGTKGLSLVYWTSQFSVLTSSFVLVADSDSTKMKILRALQAGRAFRRLVRGRACVLCVVLTRESWPLPLCTLARHTRETFSRVVCGLTHGPLYDVTGEYHQFMVAGHLAWV